jgi:hypothetical protein
MNSSLFHTVSLRGPQEPNKPSCEEDPAQHFFPINRNKKALSSLNKYISVHQSTLSLRGPQEANKPGCEEDPAGHFFPINSNKKALSSLNKYISVHQTLL